MKLFSLLPKRLIHLACNSPVPFRVPAGRVVSVIIITETVCRRGASRIFGIFHGMEKVAAGFPRYGNYFSTPWKIRILGCDGRLCDSG